MNKEERAVKAANKKAYRLEHVRRWEGSGLTKAEYCRQNGFHPNVLRRWIKQYSKDKGREGSGTFVKIRHQPLGRSEFGSDVEFILPSGIKIRMGSDMHPMAVREIVSAIMEL